MTPALLKLRSKIFHRFKMSDYGFIEGSEEVYSAINREPFRKNCLGGLGYRLPDKKRIEIWHDEGQTFNIFSYLTDEQGREYCRTWQAARFSEIDEKLKVFASNIR